MAASGARLSLPPTPGRELRRAPVHRRRARRTTSAIDGAIGGKLGAPPPTGGNDGGAFLVNLIMGSLLSCVPGLVEIKNTVKALVAAGLFGAAISGLTGAVAAWRQCSAHPKGSIWSDIWTGFWVGAATGGALGVAGGGMSAGGDNLEGTFTRFGAESLGGVAVGGGSFAAGKILPAPC